MSAVTLNLVIEQGATFSHQLVWQDDAGVPIPLAGYTARMQVRPIAASSTVVVELTTENGRITLGAADGTITLSIDAATTAGLAPGNCAYDLELVNGSTVTRLVEGAAYISAEVTR